ncbi:MAG TPA: selenocysteine-specific translation elongation factor [Thermoanaerobaculia bacterium]|nr:selenocysteine-specific translation elongation factor [Thermoanaerobaculia bacterium]
MLPLGQSSPEPVLRRVVVGTAGHIDHGKTQLVKALTGIDCDRWAEEKARGITIDLGFAHWSDEGAQIGFVDVPGHERFIHNALAGLGGIRVMLLVVAADEGVMPQTREHLAVCGLLGIPGGLVALTKSDLASGELLELAQLEVMMLLEKTPYAAAPILPVSSLTGDGLPELKRALLDLACRHAVPTDRAAPARLPIDRAFHLRGLGVVVTGTLAGGAIRAGDVLDLLPAGGSVRVRGVEVHGTPREEAVAGERTSLQLAGATIAELPRGVQLVTPGAFEATASLCASFTLLADAPGPLRQATPVRLHLYSCEVLGTLRPLAPRRLEPGESGIVELRLAAPVAAVRGDRLIVRRPSPQTTLGGGQVLDPSWRRRREPALAAALAALRGDDRQTLQFWVEAAAERGLEAAALARRLGVAGPSLLDDLGALVRDGLLLEIPEAQGRTSRWIACTTLKRLEARARRVLEEYFRRDRLARGMPRAEAVRRILPGVPAQLAQIHLSRLAAQRILELDGDQVLLSGRSVELAAQESELAEALLQRFEQGGLTPPAEPELREALAAEPRPFAATVRYLLAAGKLLRLPNGALIAASPVAELRLRLLSTGWQRFSVVQFKERFGLTRKWAIPLLEHFDSRGVTRRIGDDRMIAESP